MFRRSLQFAYGIKFIALWMLIPFILMFIPMLYSEFGGKVTTYEVTLPVETSCPRPADTKCFVIELNGKDVYTYAPLSSKEGDKVTVILRDGEYYKTAYNDQELKESAQFSGRFLKICNNILGYHVIGLAAVLALSSLITIGKSKEVREDYPKLSKITNISGMICSAVMSVILVYFAIESTLTTTSLAFLSFFLGIAYTAVFVLAWGIGTAVYAQSNKV